MTLLAPGLHFAQALDVEISSGTSLSAATNLGGLVLCGIYMPATWTTATLSFQFCNTSDGTFVNATDTAGAAISWAATASIFIISDPTNFLGVNFLKIRSGTSGTPVNQAADRTLTLMLGRPDL